MSLLRTAKAVAWSFVGLRSGKEFERDTQQLNPIHVVIAGFAGVAIFIGVLLLLVNWVVKST
jgi:nitrate reductase gamma subunit